MSQKQRDALLYVGFFALFGVMVVISLMLGTSRW